MAAPETRPVEAPEFVPKPDPQKRVMRSRAVMRLIAAQRPDEIYPILLEEIIALGLPRAMVLQVDFETGELKPIAALNCSRRQLSGARTWLWAGDNPVAGALHRLRPELLSSLPFGRGSWYSYPLLYRNQYQCREGERDHNRACLAVQNFYQPRKLQLQDQVCSVCDMRAYAGVVLVRLPRRCDDRQLKDCESLIEFSNRCLSRLFKVEHSYSRMRDMEITIGQMQTVMESMADPVILTDGHYRVILQNRAAEKFFKLPENVSEGGSRAVELNNRLFSAALSSLALSSHDSSRDLTLVDVMEGEEVLFEAVCAPTHSREGVRTGMVTVMRDVTDLRRADQELRANLHKLLQAEEVVRQDRDRLNLVVENVGDPIIVADSAAKIEMSDSLARELFGSPDQPPTPVQVKNHAKLDAYLTAFTFSFADKDAAPLRLYNPAAGSEIEYEARSGKIYDARGQVSFTVTVLRDFSTWKKLEQLKLERRMLEMEKFAATGRLAGTIAHEVNNPMEAIKNAIYLLDGKVSTDSQPVYEVLKSETERVARIVRQMLGLYRTSQRVGSMDVNSVIDDTLTLFSRQLERSGIRVKVKLGKLPPVVGSADQLRQVMSNLVVNARDSMGDGGRLIIRTRQVRSYDGVHGWVRVIIADTGSGIARQMMPTIFEPFVSTKGEKGTGLGLWIVKGIVENHGGKIRVRSREGVGTVFKLDLPVVR